MCSILGISAFYHDSAAALLVGGDIVAAAQEERFTRNKHDASYPSKAINYVLSEAKLTLSEIDYVAFYEKPFLKFERLIESHLANVPMGLISFCKAMPIWLRERLFQKQFILRELRREDPEFSEDRLLFGDHHMSHAASAFYPSPFEDAIVLTLDGVGEWATSTIAIGSGRKLDVVKQIKFPHSLGLLYSAFTYYIGFRVNSGEYKIMGLAPYGDPIYQETILEKIVSVKDDGSFWLNQSYFNYVTGLTMVNKRFEKLFGHPVRKSESEPITKFHMDIAASIQSVLEFIVLRMARSTLEVYRIPHLCLAGGVALNCVVNGKLVREIGFDDIWIQPASGDSGGAIGVAYNVWHKELGKLRRRRDLATDSMKSSYLGPAYSRLSVEKRLRDCGANYSVLSDDELITITVEGLIDQKTVGWFQNRMEFGPRALGNRSILADPRSNSMQRNLNQKVKYRESFRPFAPSVMKEHADEWFELGKDSPYMLLVSKFLESKRITPSSDCNSIEGFDLLDVRRSDVPAVTHIDFSARIHTVDAKRNPRFHQLLMEFYNQTGCPMLVNTSFNIRGEPIVCTPEEAFRCFMGTDLEILIVGDCVMFKEDQDHNLINNYRHEVSPD